MLCSWGQPHTLHLLSGAIGSSIAVIKGATPRPSALVTATPRPPVSVIVIVTRGAVQVSPFLGFHLVWCCKNSNICRWRWCPSFSPQGLSCVFGVEQKGSFVIWGLWRDRWEAALCHLFCAALATGHELMQPWGHCKSRKQNKQKNLHKTSQEGLMLHKTITQNWPRWFQASWKLVWQVRAMTDILTFLNLPNKWKLIKHFFLTAQHHHHTWSTAVFNHWRSSLYRGFGGCHTKKSLIPKGTPQ